MPEARQTDWSGARLRAAMRNAGITAIELAAFLKLKTTVPVENWCKDAGDDGASEPRAGQLGAISAATGKSVSWLLGFPEASA